MGRNYSNTAPPVSLTVAATTGSTVLTVASTTGFPPVPFILGLERGTANEEVTLCTAMTANTFTVTRGFDGTSAKAHAIGTAVEHTVAGIDYREATAPRRIPHTFGVPGVLLVPSGSVSYIPGMFVSIPSGAYANLVGYRTKIQAGTSATVNIQRNEAAIAGAGTGITVGSTASESALSIALADDDYLNLAVTGVSGSPQNLSMTLFIEYGY